MGNLFSKEKRDKRANQYYQQPQKIDPRDGRHRIQQPPLTINREYRLIIKCHTCRRERANCPVAGDLNVNGEQMWAYRTPNYQGPVKDWVLEIDLCNIVANLSGRTAQAEQIIKRFTGQVGVDRDLGPGRRRERGKGKGKPVFFVDDLLTALGETKVAFFSSIH